MDEPREKRVPFMMSERELEDVDEWRFESRVSTRAEALRRLCKIGLALDAALPGLETNIGLAMQSMQVAARDAALEQKGVHRSDHEIIFLKNMLELTKAIASISLKAKVIKSRDYSEEKLANIVEEEKKMFEALDGFIDQKIKGEP
ncbi:hypothetical protein PX860_15580 [Agrobacterium leguminum]|uniref:hypothetical protein n=1 Tax=Agrobacterium leguminum TaxID=2792015 RepID=UPI002729DD58|nr:hypothetical protein [Agrobacterium leguminum]WLD98541.1 hypothetical protein PX860_15580 [Agrobacterium leguminum]